MPAPTSVDEFLDLVRRSNVVDEKRLTLGVGSGFSLDPTMIPKFQSLTKNRFRFGEGKIVVDLPPLAKGASPEAVWMPLLRQLLVAM